MEEPVLHDNLLLGTLPAAVRARLARQLEPVALAAGDVLAEPGRPLAAAYFPCTATFAVRLTAAPPAVATADVGREGLVGPAFLWSQPETETLSVTVRLSGWALRLGAERFATAVRREPALQTLLGRYSQARLVQLEVSAVCNALHPLPARCARWLLVLADQAGRDTYILTHEQLARMLGVRRASVSAAAEALQRAGVIGYVRGQITIRDRARLAGAACACYGQLHQAFAAVTAPLPERDAAASVDRRTEGERVDALPPDLRDLRDRSEQARNAAQRMAAISADLRAASATRRAASACTSCPV